MCLSLKGSDCIICFIDQLETVIKTKFTDQLKTWLSFYDFNQIIAMGHLNSSAIFQRENHNAADGCRSTVPFSWGQINSGVANVNLFC